MGKLAIVPWGYSRGSRWRHFRVTEEIKPGAHEARCHHDKRSEAEACIARREAGAAGCIKHATAQVGDSTVHAALPLAAYLEHGRLGHHICLQCHRVGLPKPRSISEDASNAIERTCFACGKPCALPVAQAVQEGWLRVEESHDAGH